MDNVTKKLDPKAALQAAIHTLEKFTLKNESEPVVHVADLAVQEGKLVDAEDSPVKKSIAFIRHIIATAFSRKAREEHRRKRQQVQNVVSKAIDTVKRHYLFIEKLKEGSPEERKLAASTMATIKRYNALLDSSKAPADWSVMLASFLYTRSEFTVDEELKKNRIDLPQSAVIQSAEDRNTILGHAVQLESHNDPLIGREADVIRMKANTLLRQHGISFKTISDALNTVKEAPILASVDTSSSTSTLFLTIDVLPGTTIKVKGSFKRDRETQMRSTPIPDSFQLSFKSMHTGFPHPAQYTGWSLTDVLVPAYPLRLDQLPLFQPLYDRKNSTALALQPQGALLDRAEKQLRLKKEAFMMHHTEFVELHRRLCHAIAMAAGEENDPAAFDNFFDCLKKDPEPFDRLAQINSLMLEHYIIKPYAKLQNMWVERRDPVLFHQNPSAIYQGAIKILEDTLELAPHALQQEELTQESLAYIAHFGTILGRAAQAIALQHLSEAFGCTPPMLNDFEQKMQAVSYKQLYAYLSDLENDPSSAEQMSKMLRDRLSSDIALFDVPSLDGIDAPHVALVHELEVYFNTRYYTLLNEIQH